MKKILGVSIIASLLFFAVNSSAQMPQQGGYYAAGGDVSYQTFYNELDPYGSWINYPEYGYVWQPRVSPDFMPYSSDGSWVSTVDGWAWASDYDWGWAPFHYGRWFSDPSYGWLWLPGNEWAPAWVEWGQANDYYGWAPLGPNINISVGMSWRAPHNYWTFLPSRYMTQRNFRPYIVNNNSLRLDNNVRFINEINTSGNRRYFRGPAYNDVERYTRSRITPVQIADRNRPGSRFDNNRFEVYRPNIDRNTRSAARPTNIRNYDASNNHNNNWDNNGNNRRSQNTYGNAGSDGQPTFRQPQGQQTDQNNRNWNQRNQQQDANGAITRPDRSQRREQTPITQPTPQAQPQLQIPQQQPPQQGNRNWNHRGQQSTTNGVTIDRSPRSYDNGQQNNRVTQPPAQPQQPQVSQMDRGQRMDGGNRGANPQVNRPQINNTPATPTPTTPVTRQVEGQGGNREYNRGGGNERHGRG